MLYWESTFQKRPRKFSYPVTSCYPSPMVYSFTELARRGYVREYERKADTFMSQCNIDFFVRQNERCQFLVGVGVVRKRKSGHPAAKNQCRSELVFVMGTHHAMGTCAHRQVGRGAGTGATEEVGSRWTGALWQAARSYQAPDWNPGPLILTPSKTPDSQETVYVGCW